LGLRFAVIVSLAALISKAWNMLNKLKNLKVPTSVMEEIGQQAKTITVKPFHPYAGIYAHGGVFKEGTDFGTARLCNIP
jgi:hypothetical protein